MPVHAKTSALTRGTDTWTHQMRLLGASISLIFWLSVIAAITVFFGWLYFMTDPDMHSRVYIWCEAQLWDQINKDKLLAVSVVDGQTGWDTVSGIIVDPYFLAAIDNLKANFRTAAFLAGATFASGLFLIYAAFKQHGKKMNETDLVRGAKIGTGAEVRNLLKKQKRLSPITLGDVPLVLDSEVYHILATGAPGSGKSQVMMGVLEYVQHAGQCAVIYDQSGDFTQTFYNPERGDVILNPFDHRCPNWDIFGEIKLSAHCDMMAAAFVTKRDNDEYWGTAARLIFTEILKKLWQEKRRSVSELVDFLVSVDTKSLQPLLVNTPAQRYFSDGNEEHLGSILSNLTTDVKSLIYLPADRPDIPLFSIRKWIEEIDQRPGLQPWMFINTSQELFEATAPLLAGWFNVISTAVLSLPVDVNRRIWFGLDELTSLDRLNSVIKLLQMGRKYGAAALLGVQSIASLRRVYGHDGAQELAGFCSTHLVLRPNDPETAKWASEALGQNETSETREGLRYAAGNASDSINLNVQQETKALLLPSQLNQLDSLQGYVRLPGPVPIAAMKAKYVKRPRIAAALIPADPDNTIEALLLKKHAAITPKTSSGSATKPIVQSPTPAAASAPIVIREQPIPPGPSRKVDVPPARQSDRESTVDQLGRQAPVFTAEDHVNGSSEPVVEATTKARDKDSNV